MRIIFEEEHVLVHGNAVPESGRISIIEHDSSQRREIVWEPIAAVDWTFLGGSAFDTGFRQDLNDIDEYFKPKRNDSGLRYLVIKLRDGATLPSLHFSPGGIERVESAFQAFFIIKEVNSGQYKLELIEEPKDARLSLWEDDPQPEIKSGRDVLNRGFGIFSKITRAISSNIQDEMAKTSISRVFMNEGQPELPLERPVVIRSTMVDEDDFRDYVLAGRYKDIKDKIFKGGLTGGARPFAWKQLLGYDSIKNPEEKYKTLRAQWEGLTAEQEEYCTTLRERRSLIAKDVTRTDPTRLNEDQIQRLSDLLTTYCIYDQDIGYVQGMSDIAVVILDIYPDDIDAFWVFAKFMYRIRGNFEKSQEAIKRQFEALRRILAFTDGEMVRFLDRKESGHMFFCFPWFLILFRRLADHESLPTVWDAWLCSPCANFHLLIAAAVLDLKRDEIMDEEFGYCEILQVVNRLSGNVNTDEFLARAQSLLVQISRSISTPPIIKQLLSLSD